MSREYHICDGKNKQELAKVLAEHGRLLLPVLELVEDSRRAIDALTCLPGGRLTTWVERRSRRCHCYRRRRSRGRCTRGRRDGGSDATEARAGW